MHSDNSVDIKDILGDLVPYEQDRYTKDVAPKTRRSTLAIDESTTPPEDINSEILNLNDVVSADEFPVPDTVPTAYIKDRERPTVSRSYKPRASKAWTQRRAYALFLGCLNWLKDTPDQYFAKTYWAQEGIVERSMQKLVHRYPICKNVMEQIKAAQEAKLLEAAATQKIHPGFIKFFLNCQFQDQYVPHTETKQEIVGGGGNNQQVQVVFEEVKENGANKSIS